MRVHRPGDDGRDGVERQLSAQELVDRDFVRGIQNDRQAARVPERAVGEAQAGKRLGVRPIELETADASQVEWMAMLERATGIFLTGGHQLRLSTILGGTPVAKALRACSGSRAACNRTCCPNAIGSDEAPAAAPFRFQSAASG